MMPPAARQHSRPDYLASRIPWEGRIDLSSHRSLVICWAQWGLWDEEGESSLANEGPKDRKVASSTKAEFLGALCGYRFTRDRGYRALSDCDPAGAVDDP